MISRFIDISSFSMGYHHSFYGGGCRRCSSMMESIIGESTPTYDAMTIAFADTFSKSASETKYDARENSGD